MMRDYRVCLCAFLQGVKEVEATWETMKFSVQRFLKGTQEHGFILGAVDDILQRLDDDAMNLQSMAGSHYVGPFLATVQQWEKNLSLISEIIEVTGNHHYQQRLDLKIALAHVLISLLLF